MSPIQPIRASDLGLAVGWMATLAIALAACTSASPAASVSSSTGAASTPSAHTTAPSVASASATDAPADGPITVTLKDVVINLSSVSAPAGEVTFDVQNVGNAGAGIHEFVVIRTDLDAADLPKHVDASGLPTVIEDGLDIVDRVQPLRVGESASLTVNLAAGHYVFICNLAGHYYAMRLNFDVR